jgi:MFS transporter, ACS family, D-galactonate transporter
MVAAFKSEWVAAFRSEYPAGFVGIRIRPSGVTKTHPTGTPKEAWLIVALLFLFMLINFADKAVIGIAAVPIMQELQLSPRQFGLIGSSG